MNDVLFLHLNQGYEEISVVRAQKKETTLGAFDLADYPGSKLPQMVFWHFTKEQSKILRQSNERDLDFLQMRNLNMVYCDRSIKVAQKDLILASVLF